MYSITLKGHARNYEMAFAANTWSIEVFGGCVLNVLVLEWRHGLYH